MKIAFAINKIYFSSQMEKVSLPLNMVTTTFFTSLRMSKITKDLTTRSNTVQYLFKSKSIQRKPNANKRKIYKKNTKEEN